MKLELEPNVGSDKFQFGTPRDEVRQLLTNFTHFVPPGEPENDFYENAGLILGFDEQDELEYIEVVSPSQCSVFGIDVFELPIGEVVSRLTEVAGQAPFSDGGYNFETLGLALFCPDGAIRSVSLYRQGYYTD